MNRIIGNFYFRRTSGGYLFGEYTNTVNEVIYSESAIPESAKSSTFEGTYNTSWFEKNEEDPHTGKLIIHAPEGNKFKLEWSYSDAIQFWGQGFVVDGILIGFYTDEELKKR